MRAKKVWLMALGVICVIVAGWIGLLFITSTLVARPPITDGWSSANCSCWRSADIFSMSESAQSPLRSAGLDPKCASDGAEW